MVLPRNNTNVALPDPRGYRTDEPALQPAEATPFPWLATMDPSVGAGFYASVWGPLPFAFGRAAPERYEVWEARPAGSDDSERKGP